MSRILFVIAAALWLPACVMQPPPGYYASPYAPGYAGRPYVPAGYPQPYRPPAAAPSPATMADSPPGEAPSGGPGPALTGDPGLAPPSEPGPPGPGGTATEEAGGSRDAYAGFAGEAIDDGVPPTGTIRQRDFDAPTPMRIPGARTITTLELDAMLRAGTPLILIDTIRGAQTVSLPNAVWLKDAGTGRHLDDDIQAWLDMQLANLTGRDKARALVFFCASRLCWLAHNAVLRAVDLGYTNVYWYRGGRDAWRAAGLPMTPVAAPLN